MKRFSYGAITHFVDDASWKEFNGDEAHIRDYVEEVLGEEFLEGGVFWRAICRFRNTASPRIAILNAHGDDDSGTWTYFDEKRARPVQSWIDKQGTKYDCLILFVCNPAHATPKSKKTLLVVPDGIVGILDEESRERELTFSLIHPEYGEIDSNIVDYYLREEAVKAPEPPPGHRRPQRSS